MALRFALLRDGGHRSQPVALRHRTQFETIFLDFDTEEQLVRFLRHPDMVKYCENVLCPIRDIVMLVRDRFRSNPALPKDAPWIRTQGAAYLRLLVPVFSCSA